MARQTMQRAVVTQAEVQAARDLLADYGLARPSLAAAIAAALADAREGATLPGERHLVNAALEVSGHVWREARDLHDGHRQRVRQQWARELERGGLRPLGWPPVVTTPLRFRPLSDRPWVPDPLVLCESTAQADLVRLSIHGMAVPA